MLAGEVKSSLDGQSIPRSREGVKVSSSMLGSSPYFVAVAVRSDPDTLGRSSRYKIGSVHHRQSKAGQRQRELDPLTRFKPRPGLWGPAQSC